jgi:dTMP kinase
MPGATTAKRARGRFITLEGIDGAGKSTQVAAVRACLEGLGVPVMTTREPGGSPIAEGIRALLLDPENQGMAVDAELLLVFAARAEHLARVIVPALEAGTWVVCDRFTDATYAYQGGGRGIDERRISTLEDLVQQDLRPDLTLLLNLDVPTGLARAGAGRRSAPDRFEGETLRFFEVVHAAYLRRAEEHPERIRVIAASGQAAQVAERVRAAVSAFCAAVLG